ncbi:kinesin-like protein KIN-7L, partial [Stegodyphus dumicola]|uniref:kinesin-like protein KIN-7L n=1 Tax=Stegodyphus dumicola TaxID=202533 RepID=UPI0015B1A9C7
MTDSIQISIRMRPLISRELEKKATVHWSSKNSTSIYQIACPSVIFNYDHVFDGNENNETVYSEFCSPIVRSVLNGINGTIFAYGQTASGKTFTMMGKDDGETLGIVHFAIFDIFNDIKKNLEREFLLRISYMEVYNEIVSDLLSESSDNLKLQDNEFGNLIVCGLSEHIVENADQILSLMQRGG